MEAKNPQRIELFVGNLVVILELICYDLRMVINDLLLKISAEFKPVFVGMHNQILTLQEENTRLRRALYAAKSEKHLAGVLITPVGTLFNEAEQEFVGPLQPVVIPPAVDPKEPRPRSPKSGGRQPLPEDLPRERVEHDLEVDSKNCPNDGAELTRIGEEIVETLEFRPATLVVIENVYPKYACPVCEQHVIQAPAVPSVLPQTQCGPGLIAQIIICKYLLALPLYRQESEFKQMGIELSRSSMARWIIATHKYLLPLLDLLKKFILASQVIHADETHVQVLKEKGKTPQSKSYMWTICTGEHDPPAVFYEYYDNRKSESATSLLEDFKGLLHVDGYEGYSAVVEQNGIVRVGCWAHARRKFDVAKKDGAPAGHTLSGEFLNRIQKLFLAERDWKGLSAEERGAERQKISKPLVEDLQSYLDENLTRVTPKSKLGMAMTYLKNQWPLLTVFLNDGRASLSNNRMENLIRPFAIGRKNWMFSDTVAGAEASAGLYSLLLSAKMNELEARPYLISVLTEIPALLAKEPTADLSPYLPWNWKT